MHDRWRAVIWMDRDGTLLDDPGYLADPAGVRLLPAAAGAVARANDAHVAVVLITNQSGIGRGHFDETTLAAIHAEMARKLEVEAGARLDGLEYCPHRPDESCRCRKPAPGLVERALSTGAWDGLPAAVIGDKAADLGLGHAVGATTILVRTGEGRRTEADLGPDDPRPHHIADDVGAAVDWYLDQLGPA